MKLLSLGERKKEKELKKYIVDNKESLYRFAYGYVKNQDDALDIVHDSICKSLTKIDTLKDIGNIKPWIYKIISNCAIDYIRKNSKYIPLDTEYSAETEGKYDVYEDIDLKRALDLLTYDQRVIITLRFFEDMKIKDIAEITGENINTVKTRLYKALEVLRINIEEA